MSLAIFLILPDTAANVPLPQLSENFSTHFENIIDIRWNYIDIDSCIPIFHLNINGFFKGTKFYRSLASRNS